MRRFIAAMMFFTRLPIGRKIHWKPEDFERITDVWPLTGIVSGGLTALAYWGAASLIPSFTAAIVALAFRMMLTGALHEDGLADFCDGFGCQCDREKTLAIMKDSSIGTFGVLGLTLYCLLFILSVGMLPIMTGVFLILGSDVWCKFCASKLVDFLPYARKQEESKSGIIYRKGTLTTSIIVGAVSLGCVVPLRWPMAMCSLAAPLAVFALGLMMKRRIGGYTGDCCGAAFLAAQSLMFLTALAIG